MTRVWLAVMVAACGSPSTTHDASTEGPTTDALDASTDGPSCVTQSTCVYGYPDPDVLQVGPTVGTVAVRDFDSDGIMDVLATDKAMSQFFVARGLGSGAFAPLVTYTGNGNDAAAVADFDGNGTQDLVSFATNQTRVHIGQADGTFVAGPTSNTPSGIVVWHVVVANLDGDTLPDLVGVGRNATMWGVFALVNSGGFAFRLTTYVPDMPDPRAITVGNLRGDSTDEWILSDAGNLRIATNAGDGTFAEPTEIPISAAQTRAVDIDQDTDLDLVVGTNTNVSILRNLGGAFGAPEVYAGAADAIDVADLSGDGVVDLVSYSQARVSVRLGTVGGVFGTASPHPVGIGIAELGPSVDVTGDGARDLVFGFAGSVMFMRNQGGGQFRTFATYPGPLGEAVALVDLDGDTDLDVVTATVDGLRVATNVAGVPQSPIAYGTEWMSSLATGDLSNDGRPDVVATGFSASFIDVRVTQPDGALGVPQRIGMTSVLSVVIADVDGDPYGDIVLGFRDQGIGVLRGGPTGFAPLVLYPLPSAVHSLVTGDVDGDGDVDVVVPLWTESNGLAILRNVGAGALATPEYLDVAARSVALADFDCDGYVDIAASDGTTTVIGRGSASGFGPAMTVGNVDSIRAADLDHDGDVDLVGRHGLAVTVLDNRGDGVFTERDFSTGWISDFEVGDLDGDGAAEIVGAENSIGGLIVMPATCQ